MEIKRVEKKKIEYPKLNEMSNNNMSIPDKWLKVGITAGMIDILVESKTYATTLLPNDIIIAGGLVSTDPVYLESISIYDVLYLIFLANILVSTMVILYKKIRYRKDPNKNKISKKIKIVIIVSIIILALINIVIRNLEYVF